MDPALIGEVLSGLMFLVTIFAVLLGYPVAFTLGGTAIIFALIGHELGAFEFAFLNAIGSRFFGTMKTEVLVAVPLFVFMGVMLERSKIAEELLETMGQLFGSLRGGLGISVIIVGALLAASTGIVGATVVTMGLLSLPAMMRAGYDPKLASGVICASGTLGQIIPPSTVLIFMGDILQGANQRAQQAMGNLAPEPLSVGQLFAGAMLPGLMLVLLYIGWVVFKAITQPKSCPALITDPKDREGLAWRVVTALLPPLALIVAVLGSILGGIATPTESASVGAIGATILAMARRQFSLTILNAVMRSTMKISSMVFIILLGASVFSLVFRGLGGEELVFDALSALPGGQIGAVVSVMLVMFFLGFFLDTFEIIFIMVPITAPALIILGVDPLWLGVVIGVNLQTSFLTPPFGFALFYLRGVAARLVSTTQIYAGIIPFVILQLVAIVLLYLLPEMATWLPDQIFGSGAPSVTSPSGQGSTGSFGDLFGPGGGSNGNGSGANDLNDLFGPSGGGTGGGANGGSGGGNDLNNLFQ
ncbi:MAG: TRAP transporter large permease subunit [Azospirillaceae bacterium]